VDPFALIIFSGVAVTVLAVYLVGRYYPGSGLDQIGQRTAREIVEQREALEADDLEQMLAAHNARRRARGEAEVTTAELELRVVQDLNEQRRRAERYMADLLNDPLVEASNARRRARGAPVRTREDVRKEFGRQSADD
jgi:hypothetical protein